MLSFHTWVKKNASAGFSSEKLTPVALSETPIVLFKFNVWCS